MAPDHILGLVAEDLFRAAIEMNDPLGLIDRNDRVGRDRQDAGELGFRRSQVFLNTVLFAKPRANREMLDDEKRKSRRGDQRCDEQVRPPTESPA